MDVIEGLVTVMLEPKPRLIRAKQSTGCNSGLCSQAGKLWPAQTGWVATVTSESFVVHHAFVSAGLVCTDKL
jgi:hypothetical protein